MASPVANTETAQSVIGSVITGVEEEEGGRKTVDKGGRLTAGADETALARTQVSVTTTAC